MVLWRLQGELGMSTDEPAGYICANCGNIERVKQQECPKCHVFKKIRDGDRLVFLDKEGNNVGEREL